MSARAERSATRTLRDRAGFAVRHPVRVSRQVMSSFGHTSARVIEPVRMRLLRKKYDNSWKENGVAAKMLSSAEQALSQEAPATYSFALLLDLLGALPPAAGQRRLLELGCGVGHYSELLAREMPGQFLYSGADYAPEMIDTARGRWPNRNFFVADILDPKLDLTGYDVVVASALVEIMRDWSPALDVLFGCPAEFVILHRQSLTDRGPEVALQRHYARPQGYVTRLPLAEIRQRADANGLNLLRHAHRPPEAQHSFLFARHSAP